jgi:hypothetical protein
MDIAENPVVAGIGQAAFIHLFAASALQDQYYYLEGNKFRKGIGVSGRG